MKALSSEAAGARYHTIHETLKGAAEAIKEGNITPKGIAKGAAEGYAKGMIESEVGGVTRDKPPLSF